MFVYRSNLQPKLRIQGFFFLVSFISVNGYCTVVFPHTHTLSSQPANQPRTQIRTVMLCKEFAVSAHQSAFNPPRFTQMSQPSGGKGESLLGSQIICKEKKRQQKAKPILNIFSPPTQTHQQNYFWYHDQNQNNFTTSVSLLKFIRCVRSFLLSRAQKNR